MNGRRRPPPRRVSAATASPRSTSTPPPRAAARAAVRRGSIAADAGLTIAHVDCDAFYASVEKRDRPDLADKPVIVGGGGRRGVVATCCYVARTFGVRSAMPTGRALRLCPHAIVLPPDMAKYARVSRDIRERMQKLTPLVEPLSIDEAFLDLTGCEGVNGAPAALTLARFAREVEREIGVTVSVGLSYCKFLAKLASDLDKPRGFSVIGRDEARGILAPMSVGRLWGVGKVAEARLARLGLKTIGDLQALERRRRRRGSATTADGSGGWRGGSTRASVTPERETKSISSETTFEIDVADRDELTRALLVSLRSGGGALRKRRLWRRAAVTLKLRTPDFHLRSRSRSGLDSDPDGAAAVRRRARAARGRAGRPGLSPDRRRGGRSRAGRGSRRRRPHRGRSQPREGARSGDRGFARPIRRGGGAARPRLSAGRRRATALISSGRRASAGGRAV